MHWQTTRFDLDLSTPQVMGIVNVTPDSFSDGGQHAGTQAALRHCEQLIRDGAHILDIGGESTRPGSPAVSLDEELARVLPVVRGAVALGVPVSVDTYKPEVMQAVLDAGVDIVNDIQVTTVGGFVQAGQKIMQVVPVGDKLLVEARVSPKDIAFIKVNDRANVKVTAYDFAVYGGLNGKVVQISADSIYDEAAKEAYFSVVVETDRAFLQSGKRRLPISPGMICDVEIVTGKKSILSYLLKPLVRARSEALSER